MTRVIDQFGLKMRQKKRKDVSYALPGSQLLMAAVAVVFACVAESVALSRSRISERATQRIRWCNVVAQSVLPAHFYKSFFKNILVHMNGGLLEIRSVHTYALKGFIVVVSTVLHSVTQNTSILLHMYLMQFPLNKILIKFVAHLITLHQVAFASKSAN